MDDNRIIARFMGFESYPFENKDGKGFDVTLNGVPKNDCNHKYSIAKYGDLEYNIEQILQWELKYHKCWNWLMSVIEKIESLDLSDWYDDKNFMNVNVSIESGHCYVFVELNFDPPHRITGKSNYDIPKIDLIYSQIIEFIKWYNTKPQELVEEKIKEKAI